MQVVIVTKGAVAKDDFDFWLCQLSLRSTTQSRPVCTGFTEDKAEENMRVG